MTARLKRTGIVLLAVVLLAALVAGAYAATSGPPIEPKEKKQQVVADKNWKIKGNGIRPKGKPQPKKNLKDAPDPAADKAIIDKRPRPTGKAVLDPTEPANN